MKAINYYCHGIGNLDLTNLKNGRYRYTLNEDNKDIPFIPSYFCYSQMLVRSVLIRYKKIEENISKNLEDLFNQKGVAYSFKVIIDMEWQVNSEFITNVVNNVTKIFYKQEDHVKYGKTIFFVINYQNEIKEIKGTEIYKVQNLNNKTLDMYYVYYRASKKTLNLLFNKINKDFLKSHILIVDLDENLNLLNSNRLVLWIKENYIKKREKRIHFLPGYLNAFFRGEWEGILNPVELTQEKLRIVENYRDLNEFRIKNKLKEDFLQKFYLTLMERE